MNRALVFLAATAAAALAVTSACLASPKTNHDFRAENIYFTMTAPARSGDVQLSLRSGNDRHNHNMSRGFAASELARATGRSASGTRARLARLLGRLRTELRD